MIFKIHGQTLKIVLLSMFFLSSFSLAFSQTPPTLKGTLNWSGPLKKGTKLVVWIDIPKPWHIQSNQPLDEFAFASKITPKIQGVQWGAVEWPKAHLEKDPILGIQQSTFLGKIKIEIPIVKVESKKDSAQIKVILDYQSCGNGLCLAPQSQEFKL